MRALVPHDPSRALTSRTHKPIDITCVYIVLHALLSGKSKSQSQSTSPLPLPSQSLNVAQAIIKNQLRYVIAKHVAIKINVIVSHTPRAQGFE